MAGNARTRERLAEAHEEITRLRAIIAQYEQAGAPRRTPHKERTYDPSIVDELMTWSLEGQFLDEIIAQWGISRETFDTWRQEHPELARMFPIARARARAALLRHMRQALQTKSAFPASLADRIVIIMDKEGGQGDEEADALVRVDVLRPEQKAGSRARESDKASSLRAIEIG